MRHNLPFAKAEAIMDLRARSLSHSSSLNMTLYLPLLAGCLAVNGIMTTSTHTGRCTTAVRHAESKIG